VFVQTSFWVRRDVPFVGGGKVLTSAPASAAAVGDGKTDDGIVELSKIDWRHWTPAPLDGLEGGSLGPGGDRSAAARASPTILSSVVRATYNRQRAVIKRPIPGTRSPGQLEPRFKHEVRNLLALAGCPHVATLLAVRAEDSALVFAECPRGDLTAFAATRHLDALQIEIVFRAIVDAVAGMHAAAHAVGYAKCGHFDLKPSNLLVASATCRTRGTPMVVVIQVCDLGVMQLGIPADKPLMVPTGTYAYQAPEQFSLTAADADKPVAIDNPEAADVFSIGCIAHFLMTGHSPFPSTPTLAARYDQLPMLPECSSRQVMGSAISAQPWSALARFAINACLSVSPAARPSLAALAQALRAPI
jgi:serine/threonine protein kinase